MLADKNDERIGTIAEPVINNVVLVVWDSQHQTKLESISFAIHSLDVKHEEQE